jgi:ABC-type antimicrobial peptide transport system permease subunit
MRFYIRFTSAEFKSVAGPKYQNVFVLTFILSISILTVVFSQALQSYLQKKMDSPFVKFINVDNVENYSESGAKKASLYSLNEKSTLKRYQINELFGVRTGYISFKNIGSDRSVNSIKYRVADNDPFCDFLFKNKAPDLVDNFLTDRNRASKILIPDSSWGIVVSKNLLDRLNFKIGVDNFVELIYPTFDGQKTILHVVPLPILGVVSQLPDKVDVIVPKLLGIAIRNRSFQEHPLLTKEPHQQTYLRLAAKPDQIDKLEKLGFQILSKVNDRYIVAERTNIDSTEISHFDFSAIEGSKRIYKFITTDSIFSDDFEKITVFFSSLDSVRSYQNFLFENKYYLDIDIVQSKENYNKLNKTINIILIGLTLFSMYCIVLFTSNKISNHIQKNKKNLGTLKSFGMSNNEIIGVYFSISAILISISGLLAIAISWVLNCFLTEWLMGLIRITEANERLTEIKFVPLSYCLLFLFITFTFVYINLFNALRGKTPGDLIYNRSN